MKGRDKNGENELDLLSVERRKKERKKEREKRIRETEIENFEIWIWISKWT